MKEIDKRTSIRSFLGQPVTAAELEQLMRAAMRAPSAGNQQPWEFVAVDDRFTIEELRATSPYTDALKTAPLCVAVCGRSTNLRFPEATPADLGAATENLLLEAVHLGLGACWMGVAYSVGGSYNVEYRAGIKRVLHLPDDVEAYALVAIGHPAEDKAATDRFDPARIHHNRY